MAKRRRSNVVQIAPSDQRETVSIRKIKNGYVIEKSGVRRGKYYSEQEYSAAKPMVSAVPAATSKQPRNHSRVAKDAPAEYRGVGFLNGSK